MSALVERDHSTVAGKHQLFDDCFIGETVDAVAMEEQDVLHGRGTPVVLIEVKVVALQLNLIRVVVLVVRSDENREWVHHRRLCRRRLCVHLCGEK